MIRLNVLHSRRGHSRLLRRSGAFSTATTPPQHKFDGEASDLYARIFTQHYHPHGPWQHILNASETYLQHKSIPEAASILDIATGPGEPAMSLAKLFPASQVLATDISPDMIHKATQAFTDAKLTNIEAQEMDAHDLSVIESNSVDLVTCCYGLMFCSDQAQALNEIQRVLKPGGQYITTVWLDLQIMHLIRPMMTDVLGHAPPPPPINPNSLAAPGLLEDLLNNAGLELISTTEDSYPFVMGGQPGDSVDFGFKMATLPVHQTLIELAEESPEVLTTAKDAFWKHMETGKFGTFDQATGGITIPNNVFKMAVAQKSV